MLFDREDISATCFVGFDVISKVSVGEIILIDGQTGFKDECAVYSLAAIVLVAHLVLAIFHCQNRARNRAAIPAGCPAHVKAGQGGQVKRSVCTDSNGTPVAISRYRTADSSNVYTSQPILCTIQITQTVILAQVQRCQLIIIAYQRCQVAILFHVQFRQFIFATIQLCQLRLVPDIQLHQLISRAIQLLQLEALADIQLHQIVVGTIKFDQFPHAIHYDLRYIVIGAIHLFEIQPRANAQIHVGQFIIGAIQFFQSA